ncbi:DNA topoisomerase IV, alpha subunit [Thozetella sp. PMI_491]|nr:DNA topoisomerase IV, alpha subunit [Thozetella sp. PMI_491]
MPLPAQTPSSAAWDAALALPTRPSSSIAIVPRRDVIERNVVVSRIEDLVQHIVESLTSGGGPLYVPYRSSRSRASHTSGMGSSSQVQNPHSTAGKGIAFPSGKRHDVKKLDSFLRVLELAHQAVLTGKLIAKRNIYYQDKNLFATASAVDVLVDDVALTLGVGREDLNIVATAKGLVAGSIELIMHRFGTASSTLRCDQSRVGELVPSDRSVEMIDFRETKWLLVVEKDATFRTLAVEEYYRKSSAGNGILVTGKGYPDLATRRFLAMLQSARPSLPMFALVDFDPDGVGIMRTYKYQSQRFGHEERATIPRLRWLGIRSTDLLGKESSDRHPIESVTPLQLYDRKKAVDLLKRILSCSQLGLQERTQVSELQRMLMLNVKAEIQAVDNLGDVTEWLDGKLSAEDL